MFSFRRFYLSTKLKVVVLIKTNGILGSHKFTLQLTRERGLFSKANQLFELQHLLQHQRDL